MKEKAFWADYSFVMRSKQRKAVIAVMNNPQTVTQIKKKCRLSLSETSRVLKFFKTQGLAKCMNPNEPLGRIYVLTKRGLEVKKSIENYE